MASKVEEFDLSKIANEDKQSKLYKWLTEARPLPEEMTSEQLKDIYDEQATYFDDLFWQKMGWVAWKTGAEIIARHLEERGFKKDIRILDAGAGTGLVGSRLQELGYTNMVALDISAEMLLQCEKRGCYNQCIRSDLNIDKLEMHKQAFDAIVAIGIFSRCLVRPYGLDTLMSCVKKGSIICATVSTKNYEGIGFREHVEKLISEGKLELLEKEETVEFVKGLNTVGLFFTYRVL